MQQWITMWTFLFHVKEQFAVLVKQKLRKEKLPWMLIMPFQSRSGSGYVLACQSHPASAKVTLDFD